MLEIFFASLNEAKSLKFLWDWPQTSRCFWNKPKGFWVSKIFPKRRVQIFLIKKEGLKIKGLLSLILILTNPFQFYFSLSIWCACVCFVYLHYLCVSWKELSLIEFNRHICDLYKWVIFEIYEINFWYEQLLIQWNTDSVCEHIIDGVNLCLYGWVS